MTPDLPAELDVAGRPVLVVGGGPQALGAIARLRVSGADVTVVAPSVAAAVADLADRGLLRWEQRELQETDLDDVWLVVAASADPALDERVRDLADIRRLFCLGGSGASGDDADRPVAGKAGRVVLVGGGPGDPGLITMAGLAAVRTADVLIADRLAPLAVLADARTGAEIIDVSKIPHGRSTSQDTINELLIEHARAGKTVVRLKGGDNFVFGRGGEEWRACALAGIEVQVIPGVSSAIAAPALAGIPLTHRTANQGFTVITGHVPPGDVRSTIDYGALARSGTALVVMMGVGTLGAITMELIKNGLDAQTPAATIADGTLPSQRVVRSTLLNISTATAEAGIRPPAVTVIGSVAAFDPTVRGRWSWE
jgi:uroporphyrin-III C-methyltransferase